MTTSKTDVGVKHVFCKACGKKHKATLYTKTGNKSKSHYKPPGSVYKSKTSKFVHGINRGWYCLKCADLFQRDELVSQAYHKITNNTL